MPDVLLLLACSGLDTVEDTASSGEPREVVDTEAEVVVLGCVLGNARDDYNVGEVNVQARAFTPDVCEQVSETTGNLGGDFCLDRLPVGVVEVQVLYAEGRCDWWHAAPATIVQEGECGAPENCIDLGVLYECYGQSPTCED